MSLLLALDAGQTGIRSAVLVDGALVASGEHAGVLTGQSVLPQLAAVAVEALAGADVPAGTSGMVLSAGASGLADSDTAEALVELLRPHGFSEVHLAHDSVTSYVGALGDRPGVVTAAGTGVVTLAVGDTSMARVDGWGWLIGDNGAGYWIGRAALDAVMRAHDGRGPATMLTAEALTEFGDLADAYLQLQADPNKVSRIASWATRVAAHAAAGDQVCRQISMAAADELAHAAVTGLCQVGQDTAAHPVVSTVGKVFLNPLISDRFAAAVAEALPAATVVPAAGNGLDGAVLLPGVADGSPLSSTVLRSGR